MHFIYCSYFLLFVFFCRKPRSRSFLGQKLCEEVEARVLSLESMIRGAKGRNLNKLLPANDKYVITLVMKSTKEQTLDAI